VQGPFGRMAAFLASPPPAVRAAHATGPATAGGGKREAGERSRHHGRGGRRARLRDPKGDDLRAVLRCDSPVAMAPGG
jgi:hypothetical protein